jgi:hypothetical protein
MRTPKCCINWVHLLKRNLSILAYLSMLKIILTRGNQGTNPCTPELFKISSSPKFEYQQTALFLMEQDYVLSVSSTLLQDLAVISVIG